MRETLDIREAITKLKMSINAVDNSFDDYILSGDDWRNPNWGIENCFLKLIVISEAMGLMELHKIIYSEYLSIKESKLGFLKTAITPDGEPFSEVVSRMRQYIHSIEQFFPDKEPTVITKDLLQIIRDIHYTITDKALFRHVPQSETDVHIRIEGILKCVFPDLKHKPTLTKPIKNFEPDTGIPCINTLIEYKFLTKSEDVSVIADQVLADTRGYVSKDWSHFIYVIYETNRIKPEKEWVQLLRASDVPENTTIIVLSGEPPRRKYRKIATRHVGTIKS
jgi:hypothetical protein